MILKSTPTKGRDWYRSVLEHPHIQHVLEEKWGVSMIRFGITKMLHHWGFSYTRPAYTLKRADHRKQQAFQEQVQE